jgi:predicted GTPase
MRCVTSATWSLIDRSTSSDRSIAAQAEMPIVASDATVVVVAAKVGATLTDRLLAKARSEGASRC